MRNCLIACIVAISSLALAAPALRARDGQQIATTAVTVLLDQADKLSLALKGAEAHAKVDEAIALAEKNKDSVGLAKAYRMKGLVYSRIGAGSEALTWYSKALVAYEAAGNRAGMAEALTGLTAASSSVGDTAKVREYSDRAFKLYEELGDDRGRGALLSVLVSSNGTTTLDEAKIREILEIADRLKDELLRSSGLRRLGAYQFGSGDLAGARASYDGAIDAYEKIGDVESLAAIYLNLGRIFRAHGDYEGALLRYRKAIDLLAPTKERYTIVEALNSASIALSYLKREDEAFSYTERGLALARESGNQRLIDFMEGNFAGSLGDMGRHDEAVVLLQQIVARKMEPYLAPYRYQALARELSAVGRHAEGIEAIDESIRLTRAQKETEALPGRLDERAGILTKIGRFDDALRDSRESMALVEQQRSRLIPSDFLKRGYGERVQVAYARVVDLLSRSGKAAEALETSEQGRARAFLDLLAGRETADAQLATKGAAPAPASGSRSDLVSDSMATPLGTNEIHQLAKRLHSTVVLYRVTSDATLAWVIGPDAEPFHVRIPIASDKLTALVTATTAALRETPRVSTTPGGGDAPVPDAADKDLAALPMRGLGLLALSRDDKSAWRELYKTLIEPVRAKLPARGGRLTVVPHGPLYRLSFAALTAGTGRYLIEDYELHYAPAASALAFTGRRQQVVAANAASAWAIVGNPSTLPMVGARALDPLPGAAREISAIAAIAPRAPPPIRLEANGADERALARAIENSHPSVLHFATHGFVFDDPKQPPFLAMNRRGTAPGDDGRLTLDEIYNLRLSADLVVLSACRTGSGQVSSDGILGLTRGFFYAGTPSVLATFWDVTDETTAVLMTSFYKSYIKAHAKGASLRTAQLALLSDLRAGKVAVTIGGRRVILPEHPLLWAAFFLTGEP